MDKKDVDKINEIVNQIANLGREIEIINTQITLLRRNEYTVSMYGGYVHPNMIEGLSDKILSLLLSEFSYKKRTLELKMKRIILCEETVTSDLKPIKL